MFGQGEIPAFLLIFLQLPIVIKMHSHTFAQRLEESPSPWCKWLFTLRQEQKYWTRQSPKRLSSNMSSWETTISSCPLISLNQRHLLVVPTSHIKAASSRLCPRCARSSTTRPAAINTLSNSRLSKTTWSVSYASGWVGDKSRSRISQHHRPRIFRGVDRRQHEQAARRRKLAGRHDHRWQS